MSAWALDLGTTNSALARFNAEQLRPELLELPELSRRPAGADLLTAPRMVPSVVHLLEPDLTTRLGRLPFLRDQVFWGREALIGRPALEQNQGFPSPSFAPGFKAALASQPTRPLARLGSRRYSARDIAGIFLRELCAAAARQTGERIRDLTITLPVDSYDSYRAELHTLAKTAGIHRLKLLDEPVAAAMGYALGVDQPREVLLFDMGGGTMHSTTVLLSPRGMEAGRCEVRAKKGLPIGGDTVDRWLLHAFCDKLGLRLPEGVDETEQLFLTMMLAETRRVKESLHFVEEETFILTAPEELRGLRARIGGQQHLRVRREELQEILERQGLYSAIQASLDEVAGSPAEVLLVGGSTLLPGVVPLFHQRFGRDRVRAWQPFEAVVLGAATHAAGAFLQADLTVHDYAFQTQDPKTGEPRYTVVVPRGTPVPTTPLHWRQAMVPACALGEPESIFKLQIFEIGRGAAELRRFGWDAGGNLKVLADGDGVLVPLNAANPTIGQLDPPHAPGDRSARLDLAFGVSADRWLVATVRDLKTGKILMDQAPVVRIL
ncbi:MAG TPA: Hsp70 family protein [Myxococcota bacterium]|nr:Hsp70 family protein [Myxococcota bacterium]